MISDNDSDNVKLHDDDEEKAESCHAMMASLSFIHRIKHSDHISNRLMKRETLLLSHHSPCWLVHKFTLYIFTRVGTHRLWSQDLTVARGSPGYAIRALYWFIILARVSTLSCPLLVPGTGGRSKKTIYSKLLAHAHKRSVMCVAQRVIIDLWRRKIGVRFVANLCESHKQMNIYQQMTFGQT